MPDFQLRSFTPTQLPTLKLSIAYGILVLIIGGTYFFQPLLPLGVAFVVCLFAFRHWITFEMLFYIIIVMFLIVSPNVPPHEKHFRSPILLKGFLAQDIVLFAGLFLFAVGLVAQKIEFPKPKTFIEKAFLLFSISFVCSLAVGLWQGNRTEYVLSETRDFAYLMLFWLILVYASRFERVYVYFLVFIGSCAVFAVVSVIDAAVRYQFSRYNSGISFLLLAGFFFFGGVDHSDVCEAQGVFRRASDCVFVCYTVFIYTRLVFGNGCRLARGNALHWRGADASVSGGIGSCFGCCSRCITSF
jgi:hypothetical protein